MGVILDLLKEIPLSAVLKERLVDFEKKLAVSEAKIAVLERENAKLKLENEELKLKVANLESKIQQIEGEDEACYDTCPYCRRPKGQLMRLEPHPIFGDGGIKIGYYKCTRCGKEYDREHQY